MAEADHRLRAVDRDGPDGQFRHRGDDGARCGSRAAFTGRDKIIKFEGCYHGHGDCFSVKAGSGVATLGLPDSPGVTTPTAPRYA